MKYAIIVAGGSGTRMLGAELPKQFIEIAGKPVIIHTIAAFLNADAEIKIIIPLPTKWQEHWYLLKEKHLPGEQIRITEGGETRFHSVKNSLKLTSPNSIVAIHDAVRPVVTKEFINKAFAHSAKHSTAIPAIPVSDSLRTNENGKSVSVDRSKYFITQTPQIFKQEILAKSYQQEYNLQFTDDASVVEAAGYPLSFFEGNKNNIKITTMEDLKLAAFMLKAN